MSTTLRKRLAAQMASRVRKGQPTPGDVHIKAALTNISVAWVQSQDVYVADKVFPVVNVSNQSDLYYKFTKEDFLRDEAKPRAPSSESAGGGFTLTTGTYATTVEAFHKDIDDQLRANADSILQLDKAATEFVTQKLLIRRERRWLGAFFKTGVWGTDVSGVTSAPSAGQFLQWDQASSAPLADVEKGKMAILGVSGFVPNTLVITAQTFSALRNNAAIRDQFKYTSSESIDQAMMARYFGLDRILVINGVYSSSVEGASGVTQFMAGKNGLLCYSTPAPSLMQPTAGYTFAWTGFTGSAGGYRMKKIRMDGISSDRIEGEMAYDFQVIAPELGYFFSGLVS